jgi:hypothetical protein
MKRQNAGTWHQKGYDQHQEHAIEPSEVGWEKVGGRIEDACKGVPGRMTSAHEPALQALRQEQ